MGEDLSPVRSTFNGSIRVEARPERLTGEGGALILREVIERLGIHKWLVQRLHDPRDPELITHPLSELLVTTLILMGLGWRDRDDADALRDDPLLRLTYQAQSWCRPRRAVLVVQERPGELWLHHFWLLTNWTQEQMPAEDLLQLYRERGTAEGHQGELMSVLEPALSSSARPKSHYQGKALNKVYSCTDAFAHNEVLLLLNLLAYNVLHVARVLLENATDEGLSLKRLRERVLRIPGRLLLHGRRVVLIMGQSAASLWQRLWKKLMAFEPEVAT